MASAFTKIINALSGRKTQERTKGAQGKDVQRRSQVSDKELRERREKERKARARAKRLRELGITGNEKIKRSK